jgi:hypothetical protein
MSLFCYSAARETERMFASCLKAAAKDRDNWRYLQAPVGMDARAGDSVIASWAIMVRRMISLARGHDEARGFHRHSEDDSATGVNSRQSTLRDFCNAAVLTTYV